MYNIISYNYFYIKVKYGKRIKNIYRKTKKSAPKALFFKEGGSGKAADG